MRELQSYLNSGVPRILNVRKHDNRVAMAGGFGTEKAVVEEKLQSTSPIFSNKWRWLVINTGRAN